MTAVLPGSAIRLVTQTGSSKSYPPSRRLGPASDRRTVAVVLRDVASCADLGRRGVLLRPAIRSIIGHKRPPGGRGDREIAVDLKHVERARALPLPDLCHSHDWSPIAAGPGQSVLAGVLAGVTFLAVTVILTVPRESDGRASADQGLKLLFVSFFGLAVAAYLLADLGGEQACPRAEMEEALGGAILGTFAIVMIAALTWLVAAWRDDPKVLQFMRGPVYVAAAFVLLLLGTNSVGSLNSDLDYGSHAVVSWVMYLVTALAAVAAGAQAWWLEYIAGSRRPDASAGTRGARRVSQFAGAALGFLAVSTLASGWTLAMPAKYYYPHPPAWSVYATCGFTLVCPAGILILAIRGLARPEPDAEPDTSQASCGVGWPG